MMRPIGEFRIAPDHPCLPGHFPGRPVVPGVVLLDEVFALILAQRPGRAVTGLPSVKFIHPVQPGHNVSVSYDDGSERIAFSCAVGGQDAVRGVLILGERR